MMDNWYINIINFLKTKPIVLDNKRYIPVNYYGHGIKNGFLLITLNLVNEETFLFLNKKKEELTDDELFELIFNLQEEYIIQWNFKISREQTILTDHNFKSIDISSKLKVYLRKEKLKIFKF